MLYSNGQMGSDIATDYNAWTIDISNRCYGDSRCSSDMACYDDYLLEIMRTIERERNQVRVTVSRFHTKNERFSIRYLSQIYYA